MDLLPEVAAQRGNYGEERYEKLDFQRKVRDQLLALSAAATPSWEVVDASVPLDDVSTAILAIAKKSIEAAPSTPLSYLK